MSSLLKLIPVNKPQQQLPQNAKSVNSLQHNNTVLNNIKNKYPQDKIYTYIPAVPITQPKLKPTGITARPASGELIKENIFQSAGNTIKSYANYAKYFYNAAFKGEGTDYSVGKINDLAIRTGSLGIAGVLAATKLFPFAKGMEFVGLTTWFASMAIWPKVLAAPIKAIYGVDINQKYRDSYGRRKDVFEDNQYRPMDIYRFADDKGNPLTRERYRSKYAREYIYLEKVGDKLGIPRGIKNRNETTMSQMGQVAVQGKTLGMLTAGVMTPVLSSLAADAIQEPLKNYMSEQRFKRQSESITNLESKIDKLLGQNGAKRETNIDKLFAELGLEISEKTQARFNELLTEEGRLSPKQYKKLENFLVQKYFGTGFYESISAAMSQDSTMSEPVIKITEEFKNELAQIPKKVFDTLLEKLPAEKRALVPQEFFNYEGAKISDIDAILQKVFIENGETLNTHKQNALFNEFSTSIMEPFTKLRVTENKNYEAELKKVNEEYEAAIKAYNEAVKNAEKVARETAESAGKSSEEIAKAIESARASIPMVEEKRVVQKEIYNNNVNSVIKKIQSEINIAVKKHLDTYKYHIVSKDQITKIFKFAELNRQLKLKLALFERATIKNISESATAISWENIPQKYLKVLNFTNPELEILASADATTQSQVITKRLEQLVKNPEQYENALRTMSEWTKTAISKDERALIKLIGTVENPGILFKIKNLMETVAHEHFGDNLKDTMTTYYYSKIAGVQRKYRNTVDSLVRPIKALEVFKNIDSIADYILGGTEKLFNERKAKMDYYMFHDMDYAEARDAIKAYVKDIVLQKNDINNWTTKMEVELLNSKKGLKYSKPVLCSLADMILGDLNPETIKILEGTNSEKLLENKKFIEKLHLNNKIMKARFLSIHNPLLPYMTENEALGGLIEQLRHDSTRESASKILIEMVQDKLSDIGTLTAQDNQRLTYDKIRNLHNIINDFKSGRALSGNYNIDDAIKCLKEQGALRFNTSNKAISEMSGKNITDFLSSAAQSVRARNQWTRLVYSLLGGTLALSAITIGFMGKKNNFNKHIYEKKEVGGAK